MENDIAIELIDRIYIIIYKSLLKIFINIAFIMFLMLTIYVLIRMYL